MKTFSFYFEDSEGYDRMGVVFAESQEQAEADLREAAECHGFSLPKDPPLLYEADYDKVIFVENANSYGL